MKEGDCFGFYTGEWRCKEGGCLSALQCKALANSDGLDVAADVLESILESMTTTSLPSVGSVRALVAQMLELENHNLVNPTLPNLDQDPLFPTDLQDPL